jgi:inorganic pyrophosphatase
MNLENVSLGRHAPGVVNVILETPKGSRRGYKYNPRRRRFMVECTYGVPVPTDYGWLPKTIREDGKPLEAMVMTRYNARPGYIYQARPVGTLKQRNGEHKVICVILGDDRFMRIHDISDLDNKTLKRILSFFEPFFEFDGWLGREETYKLIDESSRRYEEEQTRRMRKKVEPKVEVAEKVEVVEKEEKQKIDEVEESEEANEAEEIVAEEEENGASGDDKVEQGEEPDRVDRPDPSTE